MENKMKTKMKLIMENWQNWSEKSIYDQQKKDFSIVVAIYFAVWDHYRVPLHHYVREGQVEFLGKQPRDGRRDLYWYKAKLSEKEDQNPDKRSILKDKFGIRHVVKTDKSHPGWNLEVVEQ